MGVPGHGCRHSPLGAKFPMLCKMGPEVIEAWDDPGDPVRFVAVDRDPAVVGASLRRWYGDQAVPMTNALIDSRERFLAGVPHVRVGYDDLVADPGPRVLYLAGSLGLSPSRPRLERAASFVKQPGGPS